MSEKLVKETKKKAIAREKAEENERKLAEQTKGDAPQNEDGESDDGLDPMAENGWLQPETRVARRKAKQMQGLRTASVEYLKHDDLNHVSAQRPFVKGGGIRCPNPFGRKLIEDRWATRPRVDWSVWREGVCACLCVCEGKATIGTIRPLHRDDRSMYIRTNRRH